VLIATKLPVAVWSENQPQFMLLHSQMPGCLEKLAELKKLLETLFSSPLRYVNPIVNSYIK
jgi:hypothetical protein